ncbi:MAG: TetR/AcrR family transcriptional regulator [Oscillospiraceae bacterium]|nr:TetR/AcrR family transcriptional regulator [Oscillospiraceae bacterium]
MTGNIQYLRTDRAIQSALLSLLGKKSFEKITVQDILDETPVSRATFYKHFHDKYEIVEKIQDEVLGTHRELRNSLTQASPEQFPALVERFSLRYKEISQLLMKVKTERVNLPIALVQESEEHYLATSDSPTRELEAKIYAAATTAMMVALLDDKMDYPVEKGFDVMMAVSMRLMGLPDDPELKQKILQRRKQALR